MGAVALALLAVCAAPSQAATHKRHPAVVFVYSDSPGSNLSHWQWLPRILDYSDGEGRQRVTRLTWKGWGRRRTVGRGLARWCPSDGTPCRRWRVTYVLDRLRWTYTSEYHREWERDYWHLYLRARCKFTGDGPRPCRIPVVDWPAKRPCAPGPHCVTDRGRPPRVPIRGL
jgi:hypothetical protein